MKSINWPALVKHQPELKYIPELLRVQARGIDKGDNATLFMAGEKPTWMFYVLSGEVRLFRTARTGEQIVLQRTRQGFVAEASLQSQRYHCDSASAEASSLLIFPISGFRYALKEELEFQSFWIDRLTLELRKMRAQCERLSLNSARDRIIHSIESEGVGGKLKLTQTRKAWASELGLTHETLYRTLKQLGAEGNLVIQMEASVTTLTLV